MLVEIAPARGQEAADLSAHQVNSLPVLVLNLHSRCNCRCVMCDIWKRDRSQELSVEVFEKHLDSIRALGVRWVVLSGGEPLMNSGFGTFCQLLRREGIRVTLLTAGLSLAKRAQDVAYNVDDVILSLDGPREIHDQIRGIAGAYDLMSAGIVRLLSLRPELRISARTTVQRTNHEHLCATVEAAIDLDLSGISFLPVDTTSVAFNRNSGWSQEKKSSVALTHEEVARLNSEIQLMQSRYSREIHSGYIAENPQKLERIVRYFRSLLGEVAARSPHCNAPWVSAVVGHDGSVQPCFFHPSVGNLHRETLAAIVNGPAALTFRASLDIETNPVCQRCVCSLYRRAEPSLQTSDKSDIED